MQGNATEISAKLDAQLELLEDNEAAMGEMLVNMRELAANIRNRLDSMAFYEMVMLPPCKLPLRASGLACMIFIRLLAKLLTFSMKRLGQ